MDYFKATYKVQSGINDGDDFALYLEQTPPLIRNYETKLHTLKTGTYYHTTVHKMIPSFSIMGISADFENMARKVQEYAGTKQQTDKIYDLVLQIENICNQACVELEEEFNVIKTA